MRTKTPWVSNPPPLNTKEDIIKWLDLVDVKNYTLRSSRPEEGIPGFIVDVAANLNMSHLDLERIPVRFGVVEGKFNCSCNNLKSLHNGPHTVRRSYNCFDNQLTTLEGAPKEIPEHFDAHENELMSLQGSPKTVGFSFNVEENKLMNLVGAPETVGQNFLAGWNNLTSLQGAPKVIDKNFEVQVNPLTDFLGAPDVIGGEFMIAATGITSLKTFKTQLAPDSILSITGTHIVELAHHYEQLNAYKESERPHIALYVESEEIDRIMEIYQEKEALSMSLPCSTDTENIWKHKI